MGLGLEYFPEIFEENKMARTPKNSQLGTEMAANPEVLEKLILADPQRDLTTTGLGEKFYCLCVQKMGQKYENVGNIVIPEPDSFEESTGQTVLWIFRNRIRDMQKKKTV